MRHRTPRFGPWHPHGGSHNTSICNPSPPELQCPLLAFLGTRHVCGTQTHTHTHKKRQRSGWATQMCGDSLSKGCEEGIVAVPKENNKEAIEAAKDGPKNRAVSMFFGHPCRHNGSISGFYNLEQLHSKVGAKMFECRLLAKLEHCFPHSSCHGFGPRSC